MLHMSSVLYVVKDLIEGGAGSEWCDVFAAPVWGRVGRLGGWHCVLLIDKFVSLMCALGSERKVR